MFSKLVQRLIKLSKLIKIIILTFVLVVAVIVVLFIGGARVSKCNPSWLDVHFVERVGEMCIQKNVPDGSTYIYDPISKTNIVKNLKSYKFSEGYIYAISFMSGGKDWIPKDDGSFGYVLETKNGFERYDSREELPTYAKVNSTTGDVQWFQKMDDIPTKDRLIFKDLLSNPELVVAYTQERVELIDKESGYDVKTLNNDWFVAHNIMRDGGTQLEGYYKDNNIVKIIEKVSLSTEVKTYAYYFSNGQLILIHEANQVYPYITETGALDYSELKQVFEARYYIKDSKLVDVQASGERHIPLNVTEDNYISSLMLSSEKSVQLLSQ